MTDLTTPAARRARVIVQADLIRSGRVVATVPVEVTADTLPRLVHHAGGNYARDLDAIRPTYLHWPLGEPERPRRRIA